VLIDTLGQSLPRSSAGAATDQASADIQGIGDSEVEDALEWFEGQRVEGRYGDGSHLPVGLTVVPLNIGGE
jgi:hypothetical protein